MRQFKKAKISNFGQFSPLPLAIQSFSTCASEGFLKSTNILVFNRKNGTWSQKPYADSPNNDL